MITPNAEKIRVKHGLAAYRPQQSEILEQLLDRNGLANIIHLAPAARGKTLAPLLASIENSLKRPREMTLWMVPTISLALDYEKRIQPDGNYGKLIPALNKLNWVTFTGIDKISKASAKRSLGIRYPDVLVISPEHLDDPTFIAWLISGGEIRIGLVVLDEAHLFDEWGVTFRRSYILVSWLLETLRSQGQNFKTLALSASLPRDKEETLRDLLGFDDKNVFVSRPPGFTVGPKLSFCRTKSTEERDTLIATFLTKQLKMKNATTKGVVFLPYKTKLSNGRILSYSIPHFRSRVMPKLGLKDRSIAEFSGSTSHESRRNILEDLHLPRGSTRVLLATSAFGFGVDVGTLGFSVHAQVPEDPDRLYQEISRSSRQIKQGEAAVYFQPSDVGVQTRRLKMTLTPEKILSYLEVLGIKKLSVGKKCLDLQRTLKMSDKDNFTSVHTAQMSADAYYGHALETIIFLLRKRIIKVLPWNQKHFPISWLKLRNAFEAGKGGGHVQIPYKNQTVSLPGFLLPIEIIKNISQKTLISLIEEDKDDRARRTLLFFKLAKNQECRWISFARHYDLPLIDEKQRIIKNCQSHCDYCLR